MQHEVRFHERCNCYRWWYCWDVSSLASSATSDVLVLEGSNRIGGRLRSERRGATGSTGAGTSSEEKVLSPTNWLKEVGVDALNLQGSFAALAYKGKVHQRRQRQLLPVPPADLMVGALGNRQSRDQGHARRQCLRQGQQAPQRRRLQSPPAAHL